MLHAEHGVDQEVDTAVVEPPGCVSDEAKFHVGVVGMVGPSVQFPRPTRFAERLLERVGPFRRQIDLLGERRQALLILL